MKKIIIHNGFHPETERVYKGEHIYKVINTRMLTPGTDGTPESDAEFIQMENNVWIHKIGPDKYITDWTDQERWGRVEEAELNDSGEVISSKTLGYMILTVDRKNGLL